MLSWGHSLVLEVWFFKPSKAVLDLTGKTPAVRNSAKSFLAPQLALAEPHLCLLVAKIGLEPSVVSYTTVLHAHAKDGNIEVVTMHVM